MTANAAHPIDPLARLGRQLISAAEVRVHRRRRRRTVLATSAATLALSGALGVAALQNDIVMPIAPAGLHLFAQYKDARVDLEVHDGLDETWRVAFYRNISAGTCITAPTSAMRTSQVGCGSANITAEEFATMPITSTAATVVQTGATDDTVIVTGLARPDVERMDFHSTGGETIERAVDGATLSVPLHLDDPDGTMLTVRPFAVVATAAKDAKTIPVLVHTTDGQSSDQTIRVAHLTERR